MTAAALSILTVEDDPIIRSDLATIIEDAGYSVCAAARDGVEAVELARALEPDAIVLDIGLPRLDGIQAARRILATRPVPIVAVTGRSPRDAHAALEVGAAAVLLKPFARDEVVRTLRHVLRTPNAPRRESLAALQEILALLGYPKDWAVALEERSYQSGRFWRRHGV
jgi:DNA-binding response OmpR family regulator